MPRLKPQQIATPRLEHNRHTVCPCTLFLSLSKKLSTRERLSSMSVVTDQAIVTLATNDAYCKGALVLCQSLKRHNTTRQVVVLFTPQISSRMRYALRSLFDEAIEVNVLDSRDSAHLALLSRPELGPTFTKIHCWRLVQYSKCVFMDADMLVCQNIDDLFEREELSAAPDAGWPDCFNSGLFVYKPSIETYNRLLQFAVENGSFDGADQGLLNSFFSGWSTQDIHKHLPFIYNLAGIALYSYLPAFKRFGASVKVVHFLGPTKPWHYRYDAATKSVVQENMSPADSMFLSFLNTWWDIYTTFISPLLAQETGVKEVVEQPEEERCQASLRRRIDLGAIKRVPWSIEPTEAFTAETRSKIWKRKDDASSVTKGQIIARKYSDKGRRPPEPYVKEPSTSSLKMVHLKGMAAFEDEPTKEKRDLTSSEDETSKKEEIASLKKKPLEEEEKESSSSSDQTTQDIADVLSDLSLEVAPADSTEAQDRRRWEEGNVDYMGRDAFVNIQRKLDQFLK
ncbi:glycogenin-2 isoform X2 [Amblyraja radiata]|uniref:glycogenin-2 isoform X2 n=1 Tax=Amblyraja radiata TaxID=386614 RepID=UPI001403A045|nr:glycogenin-2 isoform X2 [Amblyraja radiata]